MVDQVGRELNILSIERLEMIRFFWRKKFIRGGGRLYTACLLTMVIGKEENDTMLILRVVDAS